jgi:glutathione S-transferase
MTVSARLHRCRNPTDWLCPCGRVARELRGAGVDYEEVRHPWRKRDRDGVLDVSGQAVLPVLEWANGETICDSVRIVENLSASGR